jgi:hypothetical protein
MSELADAMIESAKAWTEQPVASRNVLFGRKAMVETCGLTFDMDNLDMEITVPFDDDMEANEAEIVIYNLSKNSVSKIEIGQSVSISAGYGSDTGIIFRGFIDRTSTKWDGADKKTVIKCFDDVSNKTVDSLKFKKGSKASTILKSLLKRTGTPIAVFNPRVDKTYTSQTTVDGDLMENIKKYAEICGISVYVMKGKIYARHISEGDNIGFTLSETTGLIESPEEFEETQTVGDDIKETVHGYKVQMLLQHRMQTAAIVTLQSLEVNGSFRVKNGTHTINDSDFITEIKLI